MEVYVGNIKKFTALPGTEKDSYAVQITSVIREEEDVYKRQPLSSPAVIRPMSTAWN